MEQFSDRGGRRIRIVVYEVGENGLEFPLIDTKRKEAKYRRPAQAIYDFVWKTYELDIANDSMYFLPTWHYLIFKQNDIENIKKMWNQMFHGFTNDNSFAPKIAKNKDLKCRINT